MLIRKVNHTVGASTLFPTRYFGNFVFVARIKWEINSCVLIPQDFSAIKPTVANVYIILFHASRA